MVGLAVLLPMAHAPRRLRPLANVDRLTRLPEYARAARVRRASALATMLMLTVLFGAAVIAGARPVDVRTAEESQPEEVMLCVGQPATDPATATFLSYFAGKVTTGPGTERIGLTSSNRRVVPTDPRLPVCRKPFQRLRRTSSRRPTRPARSRPR